MEYNFLEGNEIKIKNTEKLEEGIYFEYEREINLATKVTNDYIYFNDLNKNQYNNIIVKGYKGGVSSQLPPLSIKINQNIDNIPLSFSFNGISCKDFGLYVKNSNHLESCSKDIEIVEIPGRTGALIIDNGGFLNKEVTINCLLKAPLSLHDSKNKIFNWIFGSKGYKDLIYNDGTNLKAVAINNIKITKIKSNFADVSFSFSCKEE